jgi:CxxC motif-containing protein (DUF1111 family)
MRHTGRLFAGALALVALFGCGGEAEPASPLEPGERLPGGDTTNTLLFGVNAFIRPAENILVEHEPMFYTGNSFFNQPWVEAPASVQVRDGLGPFFNARSCTGCHARDGRGVTPESPDEPFRGLLLRLSVPGEGEHGAPVPEPVYGGQLQPLALPGADAEGIPRVRYEEVTRAHADGATYTLRAPTYTIEDPKYGPPSQDMLVSPRLAPQVIGLGLLEAITEARLEQLADPDDADGDGISGRIQWVWNPLTQEVEPGRFGWKAEQPRVRTQVASAFVNDMGITNPVFPDDVCSPTQRGACDAVPAHVEIEEDNFERVVLYTSLLAVPARRGPDAEEVLRGRELFAQAGCGGCHTPKHVTGEDAEYPEVRGQKIWPFTDLLLHDMGAELADGRPTFGASGTEWRTPPLWGLGLVPKVNGALRLMHDGRARSFEEAIMWHGGEGEGSRESFSSMSQRERDALVAFLRSL